MKTVQPKKPHKSQPKAKDPAQSQYTSQANEIMSRLRILEERSSNLRKKSQLTDQNMIEDSKKLFEEIKSLVQTTTELKREISEVKTKIRLLDEEVSSSVRKNELQTLSKYIDYWDTIKYISVDEAKRIAREMINQNNYKENKLDK